MSWLALAAAAIGAAATIYSSKKQSDAAKKASQASEKGQGSSLAATQAAIAVQQQAQKEAQMFQLGMYREGQAAVAPWRQAGEAALSQLSTLYGLEPSLFAQDELGSYEEIMGGGGGYPSGGVSTGGVPSGGRDFFSGVAPISGEVAPVSSGVITPRSRATGRAIAAPQAAGQQAVTIDQSGQVVGIAPQAISAAPQQVVSGGGVVPQAASPQIVSGGVMPANAPQAVGQQAVAAQQVAVAPQVATNVISPRSNPVSRAAAPQTVARTVSPRSVATPRSFGSAAVAGIPAALAAYNQARPTQGIPTTYRLPLPSGGSVQVPYRQTPAAAALMASRAEGNYQPAPYQAQPSTISVPTGAGFGGGGMVKVPAYQAVPSNQTPAAAALMASRAEGNYQPVSNVVSPRLKATGRVVDKNDLTISTGRVPAQVPTGDESLRGFSSIEELQAAEQQYGAGVYTKLPGRQPVASDAQPQIATQPQIAAPIQQDPYDVFEQQQQRLMEGFQTSPGYEFQLAEAEKATKRGLSAIGLTGSGAEMIELQRLAQGQAAQEWGNYQNQFGGYVNQLQNMSGGGQTVAGQTFSQANMLGQNIANQQLNTASNIGNYMVAGDTAQNKFGMQQAQIEGAQGINQANLYSDLTDIGLGLYEESQKQQTPPATAYNYPPAEQQFEYA